LFARLLPGRRAGVRFASFSAGAAPPLLELKDLN
jgi:hypothetical protein